MTARKMQFREMCDNDLAAVIALENNASEHPWPEQQICLSLQGADRCSVILDAGKLLAYGVFSAVLDEVTVVNIAVDRQQQGRGLARQLLEHELDYYRLQGTTRCLLEVRESNAAARSLYHSMGFGVDAERLGYYAGKNGREDALLMSLKF